MELEAAKQLYYTPAKELDDADLGLSTIAVKKKKPKFKFCPDTGLIQA